MDNITIGVIAVLLAFILYYWSSKSKGGIAYRSPQNMSDPKKWSFSNKMVGLTLLVGSLLFLIISGFLRYILDVSTYDHIILVLFEVYVVISFISCEVITWVKFKK